MYEMSCPFCRIIAGQAQGKILYRDDLMTAFEDARPIAPVHILLVPNQHITSNNDVTAEQEQLLGHLNVVARDLAKILHVDNTGYRLVINTGPNAGQSVFHLHMHLIGGRHLPFRFE
jgi:histidine triad (HIT) family protein